MGMITREVKAAFPASVVMIPILIVVIGSQIQPRTSMVNTYGSTTGTSSSVKPAMAWTTAAGAVVNPAMGAIAELRRRAIPVMGVV
jgi:hypothetical protein